MANPTIEEFLQPVYARLSSLKGIPVTQAGDPPVSTYDESIKFAVDQAYSLITKETRRKHILRTFTDRHFNVASRLYLRERPVVDIDSVIDQDGDELLVNEDYELKTDLLLIGAATDLEDLSVLYTWLDITYTGGLALASTDFDLFAALVTQALACYHRRDLTGLYSISSGSGGFVNVPSNTATSLVPAVKEILASYRFIE